MITHDIGIVFSVRLAISLQPLIHTTAVPRFMLGRPGMARGRNFLSAGRMRVQMKWQQMSVWIPDIRLMKYRLAVRQLEPLHVVKTTHGGQASKVMIEQAVFLHEQDDVFDIAQRTAPPVFLCQRALYMTLDRLQDLYYTREAMFRLGRHGVKRTKMSHVHATRYL